MKTFDDENPSTKEYLLIASQIFLQLSQLHQASNQPSFPPVNLVAYFSLSGHHTTLCPPQVNM